MTLTKFWRIINTLGKGMTMRKIAIVAVVVGVVLWGKLGYASDEISLNVTPQVSFTAHGQRNYLRVIVRIERHPDNKLLHLEWNSPDGEAGSSERSLEGENSRVYFMGEDFLGRSGLMLTAGHYQVRATLTRIVDGKEHNFSAQENITISEVEIEEDR